MWVRYATLLDRAGSHPAEIARGPMVSPRNGSRRHTHDTPVHPTSNRYGTSGVQFALPHPSPPSLRYHASDLVPPLILMAPTPAQRWYRTPVSGPVMAHLRTVPMWVVRRSPLAHTTARGYNCPPRLSALSSSHAGPNLDPSSSQARLKLDSSSTRLYSNSRYSSIVSIPLPHSKTLFSLALLWSQLHQKQHIAALTTAPPCPSTRRTKPPTPSSTSPTPRSSPTSRSTTTSSGWATR